MRIIYLLLLIIVLNSCIFTAQKPPESVEIVVPVSTQTNTAYDSTQIIIITLTKSGKCLLTLGEKINRLEIIQYLNTAHSLGLSQTEINTLSKFQTIGTPLNRIKEMLELNQPVPIGKLEGIPIKDSINNEMNYWMQGIANTFKDSGIATLEDKIILKGNMETFYPQFKNIKYALKKNGIYKFRLVTNE